MSATSTDVAVAHRSRSGRSSGRRPATVAAVVLVLVLIAWNGLEASEHLLTDRDPGVYATTGRWLAREGTLLVDAAVGPFADRPGLVFEEQGWNLDDDGMLEPQFLHLLPVILAGAHRVGGDRLLLLAPSVLGGLALLAVFAFSCRFVRPWWALAATAALATTLPWVHLSRDAFSEPLAVLLLFAGLAVLSDATSRGSWVRAALAGALLGAVAMARVEGFVALIPLVGWAAVTVASAQRHEIAERRTTARLIGALLAGVTVTAGLAVADLVLFSTWYLADLRGLLLAVGGGLVAVSLAGVALVAISARRGRAHRADTAEVSPATPSRRRAALGWAAAAVVVVTAATAWFVRPLVSTVSGAPLAAIAAIEEREGLAAEGVRRYSEHSVEWLSWYLGPVALVLGIAGVALLARRLVTDPSQDLRVLPFLAVFATISALYLWRPSIVPDHVWAMRRYAVVTIPGLTLLAATVGQAVVDRARAGRRAVLAPLAGAAVAAAMVAFPISTLVPVAGATTQSGVLEAVGDVCDAVGADGAAVVVPGEELELVLGQSLRSFCGIPVAVAEPSFDAAAVTELAVDWAGEGRVLHLVGADAADVEALAGRSPELVRTVANDEQLEATLTRRPDELVAVPIQLVVADASVPPA